MAIRIFYILLPFAVLSSGLVWQGQQYGFLIAALFLSATFIKSRWLRYFFFYAALYAVVFMFQSTYGFSSPVVGKKALLSSLYLLSAVIVYVAVERSAVEQKQIFDIICIAAIVQSLICVVQAVGFYPLFSTISMFGQAEHSLSMTVCGTLGNPNFVGAYLAISAPFFMRKKWCYVLPLIMLVLFLSKTSTAVIAVCVGAAFYFRRLKYLFLLGGIAVAYTLYFDFRLFSDPRFEFWQIAVTKIFSSPETVVFGLGPGVGWGKNFPLHNEWLSLFFSYGLIGFFLILMYLGEIKTQNKILITALIIAGVNACGNYPMHTPPTALLIIIILGLLERMKHNSSG